MAAAETCWGNLMSIIKAYNTLEHLLVILHRKINVLPNLRRVLNMDGFFGRIVNWAGKLAGMGEKRIV
jgi:hypothetical protein